MCIGKIHYSEYHPDVISYITQSQIRKRKTHKETSEGQMRDGKRRESPLVREDE